MGRIETKLAELGIILPTPMAPVANYVPFVISGDLVVISGQIPVQDGKVLYTGVLPGQPDDAAKAAATAAARLCFINLVAQLKQACGGDLDRVQQVIRLGGFIAASPDFTGHAGIMNGASNAAVEIFGDAGRHARTTIGVPSLPLNASVEVEAMVRIA
jgi:enamine deaminase RidA (YjgF/YER057c/UK114 family)